MKRLLVCFVVGICIFTILPGYGFESNEKVPPAVAKQMEQSKSQLIDWLKKVDTAAFAPGKFKAFDIVEMKNGTVFKGKVLDYGPYLCIIDEKGRHIVSRAATKKITLSWGAQTPKKPNLPDLDVTFIERLPRYRSNHGNVSWDEKAKGIWVTKPNPDPVWPPKGTKATFKAHVVNKGISASGGFRYEWLIDGRLLASGTHKGLAPGAEAVIDQNWIWQDGEHTVTFRVIPGGSDAAVWNNSHTDRTDSLGLLFVIAESTRAGFDNVMNMVETFSCEDWVQYHLQVMNFLFAASIYPGSPKGCLERVRLDNIIFLPDDVYQDKFEMVGRDAEGRALNEGKWGLSPWNEYPMRAQNIDWGLIHELGHQLGIIDYYTIDHARFRVFARDKTGALIDVGFSVPYEGMMRGHGPHAFEEVTAIGMNWQRGMHRGFFGDYLFRVPKECGIRILDFNGNPIAGAEVRVFRRQLWQFRDGEKSWLIPDKPVFEGRTDADGIFMLPNQNPPFIFTTDNGFTRGPSPFGDALVLSDSGLMLLEIWNKDRRDIQFTDVTEFVVGRGRGYKDKFVKDIRTVLPGDSDKVKPPVVYVTETDGWADRVKIRWDAGQGGNRPVKFKLYGIIDGLPITRQYMTEIATINAESTWPFAISINHPPAWVIMTAIDEYGNESAPSIPVYSISRMFTRIDVNSRNDVIAAGWGLVVVEPNGTAHPFPMRTSKPFGNVCSVAVGDNGRIITLSQETSQVCIFDRDGLETALFGGEGVGDGKLNKPMDIDRDASGRIYVADTGNDRVVVFDADGRFIANIGAGLIKSPVSVEVDKNGNIYVIQKDKPGVFKMAKLSDGSYSSPSLFWDTKVQPLDITSDSMGRIFVAEGGDRGIVVLNADGTVVGECARWEGQPLTGIFGLSLDLSGNLVCATGSRGPLLRVPISVFTASGK
jgi:hypothetical protein